MKDIYKKINLILAKWNPIGVDDSIALDEYIGYIPLIIAHITDKEELEKQLENILVNEMGIEYDFSNENHKKDISQICDEMIQVYNQTCKGQANL